MRLVFSGTPEFARQALEALDAAGHEIVLVLSQPDRPAGRGMKLQACAVKQYAMSRNFATAQPQGLRLDGRFAEDARAAQHTLMAARPDAMVVAAYGLILPQWALDLPALGCLNIHASLLPRWRGAAPIHRAIEAGDEETGVTIMQMDAGLDTGDMWLSERMAIAPNDTTATLHDRLATMGAELIVRALPLVQEGALRRQAQPERGVSYAHKIEKAEAAIDWGLHADALARKLRALDPAPGALSSWRGEPLKLWAGHALTDAARDESVEPGTVLATANGGVDVACGRGVLRLTQLQRAGAKRLPAGEFLRGAPLAVGDRLGLDPVGNHTKP